MKIDMKNEREKSYENGWFGTTLKEKKINKLSDICDWIKDMCELAKTGWKRQIWGAKKKDDRGVIGILNVCQKNNEFQKVKNLPNGIFDCVNLKNLLDKIKKCMENTNRGRTKQPGFSKSLDNCYAYLSAVMHSIRYAADGLKCFSDKLNVPPHNHDPLTNLWNCVHQFGGDDIIPSSQLENYTRNAGQTLEFFKKIIQSGKLEIGRGEDMDAWREFASVQMGYIYTHANYWIIKEILKDPLAKNLKQNCQKISEGLKNGTIKLEKIKEKKNINDKEDEEDD